MGEDEIQKPTPEGLGSGTEINDAAGAGEALSEVDAAVDTGGDTHQAVENIAQLPDPPEGDGIGANGSGPAYETPSDGDEPSAMELAMQEAERRRAENENGPGDDLAANNRTRGDEARRQNAAKIAAKDAELRAAGIRKDAPTIVDSDTLPQEQHYQVENSPRTENDPVPMDEATHAAFGEMDGGTSSTSSENRNARSERPSFSKYDGAHMDQAGPVKPNPEGWVDPTQPPGWAKDLRMSNEGWDNIGKKIRSGEQVDEKTRDQFLQDAETRMKNGQDLDPQFQDAVMRKLASENEAGTPPPPELAERFEEWSQEHSGEGPFDDLFANLGSKSESEDTSSETPVSETGSTTRAGLTNEQEDEYTQLREKFKSNEATIEDLKRMRELSSIQEQASTVERAREKLLNGESLTPEEWDLLEDEKQKEAAEGEKRNIDIEVEDMGTDLIQRLSRGEKVEPEEFEKFQELIAQRGLEDAGLSEEDAREAIKRSLSSELRGRLAKRETRQQKEAIEKIRELMALEMQLLALPQRLDKLQQSANSLKNKIRAKQAWVGSVSTANNEEARRQRMEMYPLYMQLVNINAEITKSKNSGRVFAAQYRDTMQHVRRKTGVTSFFGRGFLEWSDAKMNNVITSIAMDYRVVEMAMPQAA